MNTLVISKNQEKLKVISEIIITIGLNLQYHISLLRGNLSHRWPLKIYNLNSNNCLRIILVIMQQLITIKIKNKELMMEKENVKDLMRIMMILFLETQL